MFLFAARSYLEALSEHAPAMLPACRNAITAVSTDADFLRLGQEFLECAPLWRLSIGSVMIMDPI